MTPLKTARLKSGLTNDELGMAVGVKGPTISRIENGVCRPSPELALRIAKHFKNAVTRDQILFPEDYPAAAAAPKRKKAA